MAWTLCDKKDVIAITPTRESALPDIWSDWVEELIRQHMSQPNLGANTAIADEYHDGDGTNILRVRYPKIISVSALSIDDVALVSGDYIAFPNHIQLKSTVVVHGVGHPATFPKGVANVKVSYVSGGAVSALVRMTAASMIVAIVNYKGRMGADASIKWSDPDREVGERSPSMNVGLTSHLDKIMKRMLRREKVRAY